MSFFSRFGLFNHPIFFKCPALFNRFALWPLLFISHLLVVSLLAWQLLAQVDFGYSLGYRLLSIDQHIETFGPQNRYRQDFETTDKAEHLRLFGEIARSIQNNGEGLAEIRYPLPEGGHATLMREPEVVHLEDVARLVNHFYRAGLSAAVLLTVLLVYIYRRHPRPPRPRKVLGVFGASLLAGALVLWLVGPVRVFYWLHEYAFPKDHPWFFYYQDSLMTTLMKAPDLFGFIGLLLLLLTLILWALSGALLWRALSHRNERG